MGFTKKVYFHEETHLPEEGWLQGCFECNEITSSIIEYKQVKRERLTYKFIFYLCRRCEKELIVGTKAHDLLISRYNSSVDHYLSTR